MKKILLPALLFFSLVFLMGCSGAPAPEEDYQSTVYSGATGIQQNTVLGTLVVHWRIFTIIFLLISIGLIALAYPVSNAFGIQELRAWADVELSEAFVTALIVLLILVVLIGVELLSHALLIGQSEFDVCSDGIDDTLYCPIQISRAYLEGYMDKTMNIYDDLLENAVEEGHYATLSNVLGTNYLFAGYASTSFKLFPGYMIDVTTDTQEMQFLFSMRDALFFQNFILNHVSGTLAPIALFLGIIMRTFFFTRKLGGLLIAFGVGFILVFPCTYALAMYTMHTTIYGSANTGGAENFCTISCRQMPPAAYREGSQEKYSRSNLTTYVINQTSMDMDDEEYKEFIKNFVAGANCTTEIEEVQAENIEGDPLEDEDGNPIMENRSIETCDDAQKFWKVYSDAEGGNIISCGHYDDICPPACRTMPYPNDVFDCAPRYIENQCRYELPEQCMLIRYIDPEDLKNYGFKDGDFNCPKDCKSLLGLKRECNEDFLGKGSLLDEEEAEETGKTYYVDKEGCPNQCRWINVNGSMGPGCKDLCNVEEINVESMEADLEAARDAEGEDDQLETQTALAEGNCYMIIPEEVFHSSECDSCAYLIDPGFGYMPPVHMACDRLCGDPKDSAPVKDKGIAASVVDGFPGPAQMKSITKLVVPAIVLPMFNLVITFIFIRTLSPMLGGDVDLPGMMEMMK